MRIRFLLNISSNMKQFLLLLIMLFSLSCTAQKAFKPVKTALKDKKYNEAITQIEKLRTDSTFKTTLNSACMPLKLIVDLTTQRTLKFT